MSDNEHSLILTKLGRIEAQMESVHAAITPLPTFAIDLALVKADVSELKETGKRTEFKLQTLKVDWEKEAQLTADKIVRTNERLAKHVQDDDQIRRDLNEIKETTAKTRNIAEESRRTWLGRLWGVAKYVGLFLAAWLAASLGFDAPVQ